MEVDHTTLYGVLGAIMAAITAVGARIQLSHNEMVGRTKNMSDDITRVGENVQKNGDNVDEIEAKITSITDANERHDKALEKNSKDTAKLLTMHEHPDDYDFGSAKTNETVDRVAIEVRTTSDLVRDSTAASREATSELKELTGLLRLSLQATGKIVPE